MPFKVILIKHTVSI